MCSTFSSVYGIWSTINTLKRIRVQLVLQVGLVPGYSSFATLVLLTTRYQNKVQKVGGVIHDKTANDVDDNNAADLNQNEQPGPNQKY